MEAIVLVGTPGCGKSTYAGMLRSLYGHEIVERDQIRLELMKEKGLQPATDTRVDFTKWDWAWEKDVTVKQYELIEKYGKQGKSLVLSDTNLKYRDTLVEFLEKLGYQVKVQYLYTPLDVCLQRDKERDYPVSEEPIKRLHEEFIKQLQDEFPFEKESFVVVCHSCKETKHIDKLISPTHFVVGYHYNKFVYNVYRKNKDVVDTILKSCGETIK
ncbi:MAG: AAA family ATPase [Candidatus Nanopusillus acidilobi]